MCTGNNIMNYHELYGSPSRLSHDAFVLIIMKKMLQKCCFENPNMVPQSRQTKNYTLTPSLKKKKPTLVDWTIIKNKR